MSTQVALVIKNPPVNAEDVRCGFNPWVGKIPGGDGNPLQCSCLENPWTEEPGGLQSMELQRVKHN